MFLDVLDLEKAKLKRCSDGKVLKVAFKVVPLLAWSKITTCI